MLQNGEGGGKATFMSEALPRNLTTFSARHSSFGDPVRNYDEHLLRARKNNSRNVDSEAEYLLLSNTYFFFLNLLEVLQFLLFERVIIYIVGIGQLLTGLASTVRKASGCK